MEQSVIDYLTKQVQIDRNVVTFRSLSRQFNIHVNAAKNNLAAFHAASRSSSGQVYATYMLTGEVAHTSKRNPKPHQDSMDVDSDNPMIPSGEVEEEEEPEEQDSEVVPITKVLLVGENDVENAKAQYLHIFSQHVYSLSPAHLIDSSLICTPSDKVYEADAKLKADASTLLGRLVGPHVHIGKPLALAPLSAKAVVTRVASTEPKQTAAAKSNKQDDKPKLKPKDEKSALKPRPSGFLGWGKAKAKQKDEGSKDDAYEAEKNKEKEKVKAKPEDSRNSSTSTVDAKEKKTSPVPDAAKSGKPEEKRGVKRKSTALVVSSKEEDTVATERNEKEFTKGEKPSTSKSSVSKAPTTRQKSIRALVSDEDDEDDGADTLVPAPVAAAAKGKGRVPARAKKAILSDSEEDAEERPHKAKAKANARSAAVEKSLRAMMDIDDDEVIRASRPAAASDTEPETEVPPETQTEDFVEDSESERAKQRLQKKKKQKKPVPVGRNGLKKRRVMRTRTKTDEKGYMVTEDYSSYESVDEEEAEEPVKNKGKGKKSAATPIKDAETADEDGKDVKDRKAPNKDDSKATKPAQKPAKPRRTASKKGQGTLMNFFGSKT